MAMKAGRQTEWPRIKREKDFAIVKPDTVEYSDRPVVGPLRTGTAPGVGPRGLSAGGESRVSDYGMDRVSTREFDPIGTSSSREGQRRYPSDLIARRER